MGDNEKHPAKIGNYRQSWLDYLEVLTKKYKGMIKVLEEKEVPRAQVECISCGSLLEYGNADLSIDYRRESQFPMTSAGYTIHYYQITCPVCGCKVNAGWIRKEEK